MDAKYLEEASALLRKENNACDKITTADVVLVALALCQLERSDRIIDMQKPKE